MWTIHVPSSEEQGESSQGKTCTTPHRYMTEINHLIESTIQICILKLTVLDITCLFGFEKKKIHAVSWGELGRPRIESHHEAQTVITWCPVIRIGVDNIWWVTTLVGLVDWFTTLII
jgi:hypothetical protein